MMDGESKTKPDVTVLTVNKEMYIKDCPVKNVTIFTDRAEVNRLIDLDLPKGNVEVLLKNLPSCVDEDSIRYSLISLSFEVLTMHNTYQIRSSRLLCLSYAYFFLQFFEVFFTKSCKHKIYNLIGFPATVKQPS